MLISETYRQLNARMHIEKPQYGVSGRKYVDLVRAVARELKTTDLLDYGCGKQTLKAVIGEDYRVRGYDPALPGLDAIPEPADLVVCTDVLEHIEPDCLDAVLDDLARVMRKGIFMTVCTCLAAKHLPDGRNAHLIVEHHEWWLPRLWQRFEMHAFQALRSYEFAFIGKPRAINVH